jgi:hypothetical protein
MPLAPAIIIPVLFPSAAFPSITPQYSDTARPARQRRSTVPPGASDQRRTQVADLSDTPCGTHRCAAIPLSSRHWMNAAHLGDEIPPE